MIFAAGRGKNVFLTANKMVQNKNATNKLLVWESSTIEHMQVLLG